MPDLSVKHVSLREVMAAKTTTLRDDTLVSLGSKSGMWETKNRKRLQGNLHGNSEQVFQYFKDLNALLDKLLQVLEAKEGSGPSLNVLWKELQTRLQDISDLLETTSGRLLFRRYRDSVLSKLRALLPHINADRNCGSVELDEEIFTSDLANNEVFLLKGFEFYDIAKMSGYGEIGLSGDQLHNITAKFILLECDEDIGAICTNSINPVHLIQIENGRYFWVNSSSNLKIIQQFTKNKRITDYDEQYPVRYSSTTNFYWESWMSRCDELKKTDKVRSILNANARISRTALLIYGLMWSNTLISSVAGTQIAGAVSTPIHFSNRSQDTNPQSDNCTFTLGKSPRDDTRFECDNMLSTGNESKVCHFNISVGITKYPENITLSAAITFLQAKVKDLPKFPSSLNTIWKAANAEGVTLKVPPRTKQVFYQIIGTCGSKYEIRTSDKDFEVFNAPTHQSKSNELDSLEWKYFKKGSFPVSSEEGGFEFHPSRQSKDAYPYLADPSYYDCDELDIDCDSSNERMHESTKPDSNLTVRSAGRNSGITSMYSMRLGVTVFSYFLMFQLASKLMLVL